MKIFRGLSFIAFILISSAAYPATINVPSVQPTIQAGVDAAVNGDTVLVADGVYTGDGNRDINFGGKLIVIKSENGSAYTTIDAGGNEDNRYRCFVFTSGEDENAKVEGFTLTGGYGYFGGALYTASSSPSFLNCVFTENNGADGGAACCKGAAPTFDSCIFSSNEANTWGGAVNLQGSFAIFTDCQFQGNRTIYRGGGAVFCQGANPSFDGCSFVSNFAQGYGGGGIWGILGSTITATNCVFTGNTGPTGGGLTYWSGSEAVLTNCTFFGNCAFLDGYGDKGGAIYGADEGNSVFDNCIFAFNTKGAAIVSANGHEFTLSCCDIYGNTGGDWVGDIVPQATVNGNFSENPRFCYPDEGDLTLQETSPCAATANSCGVLIGALDINCEDITLPVIHCPEGTISALPDAEGVVCVTLVIENVESGTVDAGSATWSDNMLCFTPAGNGTYPFHVVATNDDGNDECDISIYVRFAETHRVPDEFSTIQAAIDVSEDTDTVLVASGEYTGVGNHDIDFHGKRIVVRSEYGARHTVINCEGDWGAEYRGFYFHSGEDEFSLLDGFTIIDGFGSDWGGAISCDSASSPTIQNCVFESNFANQSGGGVAAVRNSNPLVQNCVFKYNMTDMVGGGISVYRSSPIIRDCVFNGCSAPNGLTIYCEGNDNPYTPFTQEYPCEPEFYNCLILRSMSGYLGAAMSYAGADPLFSNCTFYGSSTPYGGSALYAREATGRFEYCVVAFNDDGETGPVYCENVTATPSFECCDIYGNSSGDWTDCISGQSGTNGNMSTNPLFCDTTGYLDPDYVPTGWYDKYTGGDFHLNGGSPCAPTVNSCNALIGALDEGCANTPAGTDVEVVLYLEDVTVTYDGIYEAGETACDIDSVGPEAPSGFMTTPSDPETYYNITTSAGFEGHVEICVVYDQAAAPEDETELTLQHYDGSAWVDITTSVDTLNNVICGSTTTLSPFIVAQPIVTGVSWDKDGLPKEYALSQNYPNPFNPNTEIQFALPKAGQVRLSVYNILGQRVIKLVDGLMPAGYHSVTWDSKNSSRRSVASGIYFYKLEAGEFVSSKKMLLLK